MARQIRKYADKTSLKRYIDEIIELIDRKSDVNHTHDYINGKTIVISNTVPTVNDENVITLYCSELDV